MPRRLMSAWVGLLLVATIAQAQIPFSKDLMPARTSLARLGLERHWFNVIPLGGNAEKVSEVSIDEGLVFAQTDKANFFAYDAESGRLLWTANFGKFSVDAYPASANSTMIFVTNSNTLHALDRKTGREVWTVNFESIPAGSTSADEDYVWVGMNSGMLHTLRAKDGKELWNVQSRGALTSRPHPAGRVIAYASHDGRVYASRTNFSQPLWQWAAGGPVTAPLGAYGIRTLLVPSLDKSLYAVDLFTAETKWNFPTGAPVEQEPLVSGDDVFVINNQGSLSSINAMSGSLNWTISTLNGSLLGVTKTRVYLESMDGDLFIVDRGTGQVLFSPRFQAWADEPAQRSDLPRQSFGDARLPPRGRGCQTCAASRSQFETIRIHPPRGLSRHAADRPCLACEGNRRRLGSCRGKAGSRSGHEKEGRRHAEGRGRPRRRAEITRSSCWRGESTFP
jgi:outer membrane protein assembly factor BamB